MNVHELISLLNQYPADTPVAITWHSGIRELGYDDVQEYEDCELSENVHDDGHIVPLAIVFLAD